MVRNISKHLTRNERAVRAIKSVRAVVLYTPAVVRVSLVVSPFDRLEALLLLLLQGPPLPRVDQPHAERVVAHVVLAQRRRKKAKEGEVRPEDGDWRSNIESQNTRMYSFYAVNSSRGGGVVFTRLTVSPPC